MHGRRPRAAQRAFESGLGCSARGLGKVALRAWQEHARETSTLRQRVAELEKACEGLEQENDSLEQENDSLEQENDLLKVRM
jgi:cell division protein FtsB